MYRTCIAVVDASRARLFTYERSTDGGDVTESWIEERDLINPARRQRPSALFSDTRPGSSRAGGRQFAFDDHRDAHIEALDAAFSRAIIDELLSLLRAGPARRLIMCASPRMLGELRDAGREISRSGLEIDEVPRDLVKLTPPQLRDQLASYGLLPVTARRAHA